MAPQVLVEQAFRNRGTEPDRWIVTWRIENLGQDPLQILAARLPHSKFRSDERELSPMLKLLPKESARLDFSVACGERPGTVVENAFLILRVLWQEKPWRILIRFRVRFDEESGPQTVAELVTTQRVGFSVT
ncbi:MAG: hypothetical protein ACREQA_04505 [Candidatus Binatia bacterium]